MINFFQADATGYYPVDENDPEYKMEGGKLDRNGNPIFTLDQYRRGEAPFVTVAMDAKALPYGATLLSPDFPDVPFRVADTGSAFHGKGLGRIDIARDSKEGANSDENNGKFTFQLAGTPGELALPATTVTPEQGVLPDLSALSIGGEVPDLPPMPIVADTEIPDLSQAMNAAAPSIGAAPTPVPTSSPITPPVADHSVAPLSKEITKTQNPDGSVTYSDGLTIYKEGFALKKVGEKTLKIDRSGKQSWLPEPPAKNPILKTLEDGKTYDLTDINNPKLIKAPGSLDSAGITKANPFEGLTDMEKAKAKALIEGRLPVTSRMLSSKDPNLQKVVDRVLLADDNFTPANYDERRKTFLAYTPDGKEGQNMKSLNQTINHLGHLEEISPKVGSVPGMPFLNSPIQAIQKQLGINPALRSYGVTSTALTQELSRLLKGGVATLDEVKEWRQQLAPSQSIEYRDQAFKDIIALLKGRMDATAGGYKRIFGENPKDLITPEAKKVLEKHGWDIGDPGAATVPEIAPPEATPAPTPQEQAVVGLKPGDRRRNAKGEEGVYVPIDPDHPLDPRNWQLVK